MIVQGFCDRCLRFTAELQAVTDGSHEDRWRLFCPECAAGAPWPAAEVPEQQPAAPHCPHTVCRLLMGLVVYAVVPLLVFLVALVVLWLLSKVVC